MLKMQLLMLTLTWVLIMKDTLVNHTSKTYKGKTFVVQYRTNYL